MAKRQPDPAEGLPLIKVAGMSAAGKSTLVRGLRARGFHARPVSQEHSNVPDLWRRFGRTGALIFLNISLAQQRSRRPDVMWTRNYFDTEQYRLRNAYDNADLHIDTSEMTPEQVLRVVLLFLEHHEVAHAHGPLPPESATGAARKR